MEEYDVYRRRVESGLGWGHVDEKTSPICGENTRQAVTCRILLLAIL